MTFKVDFRGSKAIEWSREDGEVKRKVKEDYNPRFYIHASRKDLRDVRPWISSRKSVKATVFENWYRDLGSDEKNRVLRVDVKSQRSFRDTINRFKNHFSREKFRFYNVDLTPQFRYCLQESIEPLPEEDLVKTELTLPRVHLANNRPDEIRIDGERIDKGGESLEFLGQYLERVDPDILVVNRGGLLEFLEEKGISLGREDGFEQLAGSNTVSSYGQAMHSAARYNVPGRIVIDRSNSFILGETSIQGLWDLVERSWKPLQELAWGSIGNILTAIEVQRAYLEKDTLTPWKNWEGERFRKADTVHKADRGGFLFNPEPGVHRDIVELDFASLYPNIMVKKNISPETVSCDCCENSEVPELDYTICQKKTGFISEVLEPLVKDRQEMKKELKEADNEDKREYLQGAVDSIKWILVSCFGYMGHAHASYGAMRCHQAINAYDREIMVDTKETLEKHGYSIKHGIVDSLWAKPGENSTEVGKVCEEVSKEVGIELEHEHDFEWVAFIPRSSTDANISTLNRYFGKKKEGGFKTAGIECEQRSTSEFVKDCQLELIERLDETMEPEKVCELLKEQIDSLKDSVKTENLVKKARVTRELDDYSVENRTVAAMKRGRLNNINYRPGQDIHYVVRDDTAESEDRVRLDFEADSYDEKFYRRELIRAAESVLSPLGWKREQISDFLGNRKKKLTQF
ncbi:MAG: type B DNA-directed DNA polymerase [Candidatus Nanohaloarchaea archaeon]